jgi:hypothetical protein
LVPTYVELKAKVIEFIISTYTVQFDVYLKQDVLSIPMLLEKDLNYKSVKREGLEEQQGFKEMIYRKEH